VATEAFALIETWRSRLIDGESLSVFSASEVQDRLFDLYGELAGRPSVEVVKPWLVLTVHREIFSGQELLGLLDEVTAAINADLAEELEGLKTELSEPVA
jgi:hypothetical protein